MIEKAKKILVVDDELKSMTGYVDNLELDGYIVFRAPNGKEGLGLLNSNKDIDVILTDIKMPQMDGIELTQKVKNINPNIPVILITAYGRDYFEDAVSVDSYWYLNKFNFGYKELRKLIDRAIIEKRYKQQILEQTKELEGLTEILSKEKKKHLDVLNAILPDEVIKQLIQYGTYIPQKFSDVTVLFADLVDFSSISQDITPEELINELDQIFRAFDHILQQNNCTRIKTLGDGYLAVSGVPLRNKNHVVDALNAAKDMVSFLEKRKKRKRIRWEIRIGVHSGDVIDGVVGKDKYNYDIFGITVNDAQRILSVSEPMKIAVSNTSYSLLKSNKEFKFLDKGIKTAKHGQEFHIYELTN